jgi:hypothetical protein
MDPKDAIVGKPTEREVWLSPTWDNYKPITAAQPKGWTRVTVRDTTYADGRVVTHVLDENHQPITAQILDQQTDDDQARRFQQQQTAARQEQAATQRQTDQAERKKTRVYTGTDPQTGRPATVTEYESGPPSYEEIKPTANTQATTPRVEGTPLPGGGFDNSHPLVVNRDASGQQVGPARELTADERTRWEQEQGRQQTATKDVPLEGYPGWNQRTVASGTTTKTVFINPQGQEAPDPRPAANQGGSVRKPVPNRPGIYEVTTKDATTNATETHYEDEQGNRVPTPTDAGAIRKPVQDHPGVYEVTTKDPATNTVETHFENESGQRVPTPADASKPVQVNGQWGVWKPNPNDPSGAPTFEPIQNAPSAYAPLPPGVPRFNVRFDVPDLGLGDRKAQLDALVTQGVITPAQANATMTADAGNAKAGAENLGAIVTIQEQNRSTGIAQRGQDLGEQQSRRSFVGGLYNQAASGFNNSKVLPGAGAASANGFLAMMQAGMNLARQNGGFRDVPRVENGPLLNQFGQATLTPSGSYTVPTAAGSSAAPAAAPSAEDLPWLQHQPLTNSGAAFAPAATPAAAPTTTISPSGEVTINHTPALLQPAPATTSGPLLAPPPLDPGETVTPQAGMWHPNHDGLIDDMVNAGFEPDAIAAAFPDLHRYGPSPSLVA